MNCDWFTSIVLNANQIHILLIFNTFHLFCSLLHVVPPLQHRIHFTKEVSLPPLNFHSITTLRTMSNFVRGELRKEVLICSFSKFLLVQIVFE